MDRLDYIDSQLDEAARLNRRAEIAIIIAVVLAIVALVIG
jgi:hypothetical protein